MWVPRRRRHTRRSGGGEVILQSAVRTGRAVGEASYSEALAPPNPPGALLQAFHMLLHLSHKLLGEACTRAAGAVGRGANNFWPGPGRHLPCHRPLLPQVLAWLAREAGGPNKKSHEDGLVLENGKPGQP